MVYLPRMGPGQTIGSGILFPSAVINRFSRRDVHPARSQGNTPVAAFACRCFFSFSFSLFFFFFLLSSSSDG